MKKAEVFEAAKTGIYPAGITIKDLSEAKDSSGCTALHVAAFQGHLPPGTTVQELSSVSHANGLTPLHIACMEGKLPAETTAHDLANVRTQDGHTALHTAAEFCHLPADTTIKDLLAVRDNNGKTAFDSLVGERISLFCDKAKTQIEQVLEASVASADVNCTSAQLREIGEQLVKIQPEATNHWMTTEMIKRQNAMLGVP
jgi:hypothetical protein